MFLQALRVEICLESTDGNAVVAAAFGSVASDAERIDRSDTHVTISGLDPFRTAARGTAADKGDEGGSGR